MVQQMVEKFNEYRLVNSGVVMASGDNRQVIMAKKSALGDTPSETTNTNPIVLGNSHLIKDGGLVSDSTKVSGNKRQQTSYPSSPARTQPSGTSGTNGHLVYVRRKLETEAAKTDSSHSAVLKKPISGCSIDPKSQVGSIQEVSASSLPACTTVSSTSQNASPQEPTPANSPGKPLSTLPVPAPSYSTVPTAVTLQPEMQRVTVGVSVQSEPRKITTGGATQSEPQKILTVVPVQPEPQKILTAFPVQPEPQNISTSFSVQPGHQKVSTVDPVQPQPQKILPSSVPAHPERQKIPTAVPVQPDRHKVPIRPETQKIPTAVPLQSERPKISTAVSVQPEPHKIPTAVPVQPEPQKVLTVLPVQSEPQKVPTAVPVRPETQKIPTTFPVQPELQRQRDHQYWEQRYAHLQMHLKSLDESSPEEYAKKLRSMSAAGRSVLARDLERRAMQLAVDEGKELQRMQHLNVLRKTFPDGCPFAFTQFHSVE
ncbi:putative flocculation protein FLO11 isoform X2 [Iris pallida]|uniref:Flocculation protein FLO11 isoform X2 n=1 Tax=Iris pallida TaxID=29817 RepID=A0AAX6GKQ7_IRIPA|nr:putative flocculation protein FLO11 isoform X2 [Iris pallida]